MVDIFPSYSISDSACNSLDNKLTNESAMTLTPSEYENEHQQKLSFSKENSKALSDDESDYALCSDVIQNVYSIIHTVLVFFKVGMRDRIHTLIIFHRFFSTHIY